MGEVLRLPRPPSALTLTLTCLLAAGALLIGVAVPLGPDPRLVLVLVLAILVVALALWLFGHGAPLLAILALVPLFPVTTIGPLTDALGGLGSELRAAFIVAMLLAMFLMFSGGLPRPHPRLRPIVGGLLVLAGLGAVLAAANASGSEGFPALLAQLTGQPLVFAGVLIFLSAYLRDEPRAREWILLAFSTAVVLEAGVVLIELSSGAAFDALRGFTRAQGTVGANFLSAFAMIGVFVGLAEQSRGRATEQRWLWAVGVITVLAGLGIIVGAVARGGVIGLLLGGVYLVFTDVRLRRRAPLIATAAVVVLAGSLLTPVGDLWTERLSSRSVEEFDRPATWISGVRIGTDNIFTGLGEEQIIEGIAGVREYRQTPLGDTYVLPHNSWVLVFAEGGIAALVVLVALTWLVWRAVRTRRQRSSEERYYVAGLIGITAIAVINNVFRHPELMIPTLMLVALIVHRPPRAVEIDSGAAIIALSRGPDGN